ncbi:MAG: hypothetical protein ABH951_01850 [Patescibacteria group bacterium]
MQNNFKNKKNLKKSAGFMMVEVLVAVSIITASVLASMAVAQKSITLSYRSLHTAQASFLLEEGAEAIRIIRDDAWANISSLSTVTDYYLVFSGGTWTLSVDSSQVGNFTRKINIADVNRDAVSGDISVAGVNDTQTKLITVLASWPEAGAIAEKTLSFYITDIFT